MLPVRKLSSELAASSGLNKTFIRALNLGLRWLPAALSEDLPVGAHIPGAKNVLPRYSKPRVKGGALGVHKPSG